MLGMNSLFRSMVLFTVAFGVPLGSLTQAGIADAQQVHPKGTVEGRVRTEVSYVKGAKICQRVSGELL